MALTQKFKSQKIKTYFHRCLRDKLSRPPRHEISKKSKRISLNFLKNI